MVVRWILLGLVLTPFAEALLLWQVGSWIGLWWTLLLLVASGLVGVVMAKREGLRVIGSYRDALRTGRMPEEGIVDGLLVLVGGGLLAFPGLLTDVAGIVLLVPYTRRMAAERIRQLIARKVEDGFVKVASFASFPVGQAMPGDDEGWEPPFVERELHGDVIDTEGVEVHETRLLGDGKGGRDPESGENG